MTTVRDICSAALRRIRVLDAAEAIDAGDMSVAVDGLNRMIASWEWMGVRLEHQAFADLNAAFSMFVPDAAVTGATMSVLAYQGTWDAGANTPSLVSATGTQGDLYRVSTAGSATLDGVASWAVNDFAVYNGSAWLKSKPSAAHERHVIDLLALALSDEFGKPISPTLQKHAADAWNIIQATYVRVDPARFDSGLVYTSTRRYGGIV